MAGFFHDYPSNVLNAVGLAPAARTASADGTGRDFVNGDGLCHAILIAGVITDGTHAVKLAESDDNSSFTDISGATFTSLTSSAGGSAVQSISFLRTKRYLRATVTITGSPGTGGIYGVVLGEQKKQI